VWREYAAAVERTGSIDGLARYLPQLRFPLVSGMKRTPAYRAVTRRGEFSSDEPAGIGFALSRPSDIAVLVHATVAGAVAAIVVQERSDFVSLVCALANNNEPRPMPDALGGCMVTGYTNWHRIHRHCRAWREAHPAPSDAQ
jgi:hypothetical protein